MVDPRMDINKKIQAKIAGNEFNADDRRIKIFAEKMFVWEKEIGDSKYSEQYLKTLNSVFNKDKELK